MKKILYSLVLFGLILTSCSSDKKLADSPSSVDPAKDWNLGVAFWTFHTLTFADALSNIDSSGLDYIELNTFHRAGAELNDSSISALSPAGIQKLIDQIKAKNLHVESVYIAGDSTIASWKHQFDIAKQFGARFVTGEPPMKMWDSIDSLANVYNMKVALHEHWKGVSQYWHPDTVLLAIKDHPNFGACADLGHWPKSGIDPVDAVKKLQGNIIALHLKDIAAFNNPKLKDVVVGTGVVNVPAIFQLLKDDQFKGPIYIERDSTEAQGNLPSVIQTVKYYNDQIQKLK
jgi:L-ribulose-5-phosphate 3-epimerase